MKQCSGCKQFKTTDSFHKNRRQYDGVHDACKDCRKIETKKYTAKTIDRRQKYKKNRYHTDISFRLSENIRTRVRNIIKFKKKTGSAIKDLGCSVGDLKKWLEQQFELNMSWDNYGHGKDKWNVDHIIPLSKFDLTDRKQFLKACHWFNLRPMWQIDNFSRGNRIDE